MSLISSGSKNLTRSLIAIIMQHLNRFRSIHFTLFTDEDLSLFFRWHCYMVIKFIWLKLWGSSERHFRWVLLQQKSESVPVNWLRLNYSRNRLISNAAFMVGCLSRKMRITLINSASLILSRRNAQSLEKVTAIEAKMCCKRSRQAFRWLLPRIHSLRNSRNFTAG